MTVGQYITVIDTFLWIIQLLIFARVIVSFITRGESLHNSKFRIIYDLTEPILAPFRMLINKLNVPTGMMDFSPILALLFIDLILKRVLIYIIMSFR